MARERSVWKQGTKTADFYKELLEEGKDRDAQFLRSVKVIHPENMPWEDTPHGKLKHVINEKMEDVVTSIDCFMLEIPPGGASGKHRHMAEEFCYVLEGKGYDIHHDVDVEYTHRYNYVVDKEGKRFDWEIGDSILIPVNTVHQHFNADPEKTARLLCYSSNLYRHLGYSDLEELQPDKKND